jgi:hypothetical protein
MRTVVDDARYILQVADHLLAENVPEHYVPGRFIHEIFTPMLEVADPVGYIGAMEVRDDPLPADGREIAALCCWVVHALRLEDEGAHVEAYQAIVDAHKRLENLIIYLIFHRKKSTKKATDARHMVTEQLKDFAQDRYLQGRYPSRRQASFKLEEEVRARAAAMGKTLSEQSAQETIYKWLLDLGNPPK